MTLEERSDVQSPSKLNLRHPSQSPVKPEEDRPSYTNRTPPNTPFQPGFYRTPVLDPNRAKNADYKLPTQKTKTSIERWTKTTVGSHVTSEPMPGDYHHDEDYEF